jgi:hypothetical protein
MRKFEIRNEKFERLGARGARFYCIFTLPMITRAIRQTTPSNFEFRISNF